MAVDLLLPIKVVFPRKEDFRRPHAGGAPKKPVEPVTPERRVALAKQVRSVKDHFAEAFKKYPGVPAVARALLHPLAVAKSHRPLHLLQRDTCPIIGGGELGELYVSVLPDKLDRLAHRILNSTANDAIPNIAALSSFVPFKVDDALTDESVAELEAIAAAGNERLCYQLFSHVSRRLDAEVEATFSRLLSEHDVRDVEGLDYGPQTKMFCFNSLPPAAVRPLATFIGTQSLSRFPMYRTVRTVAHSLGSVSKKSFPPPTPGREYPVVGIIDSGTDPNNPHLQAWVESRHEAAVPRSMQNNEHGSFVAGLLAHARLLNHGNPAFPDSQCKIVDIVALDRKEEIDEYDLRNVIDDALRRFPKVPVWNLSLGMVGNPCENERFSRLGKFLDSRSQAHGIQFVNAAGNYAAGGLRSWPPGTIAGDGDRICPPADAVRSITVGSTTHKHEVNSVVTSDGAPSPFTRRGPGAGYHLKPEVSHIGGNCTGTFDCVQTGVISIDGRGNIAENVGTSFATPLVSGLVAGIWQEINVGTQVTAPTFAKAMLLHSAFMRNAPLDENLVRYIGLGCPPDLPEILNCRQSSATMIFDVPVGLDKQLFEMRPFPIPKCMTSTGKLVGEVFMTLLYDPPLDRRFSVEYCRTNVTASLGIVQPIADSPVSDEEGETDDDETEILDGGKSKYVRKVEPAPKGLTRGYERELVENGYKWSPLKLYYHRFRGGPVGYDWRLTLRLLHRAEYQVAAYQQAMLLVTMRSPMEGARVYDDLVGEMNRLSLHTQDLQLKSRQRAR